MITKKKSKDLNNYLCIFRANRCTFRDNTYPDLL